MIYRQYFLLPFHFLNKVFQTADILNVAKVQFITYFYFMVYAFVCPKKSVPTPKSKRFLNMFPSSRIYIVLALRFHLYRLC